MQDARSEYPRLEPILIEAWKVFKQTVKRVGESESRMSDSSSEQFSMKSRSLSQISLHRAKSQVLNRGQNPPVSNWGSGSSSYIQSDPEWTKPTKQSQSPPKIGGFRGIANVLLPTVGLLKHLREALEFHSFVLVNAAVYGLHHQSGNFTVSPVSAWDS